MAKQNKKQRDETVPLENKQRELFCRLYAGNRFGKCFGNATQSYLVAYDFASEIERNLERTTVLEEKKGIAWKAGQKEEHKRLVKQVAALYTRNESLKKTAASNGHKLLINAEMWKRIEYLFDQYLEPGAMDREMAKVIAQDKDLMAKVVAYDKVAKVRGRINEKLSGELVVRWQDPEDEEGPKPKGSRQAAKKVVKEKVAAGVLEWGKSEE